MESQIKFRLAICGGGIGGLALAAVLGKFSKDIQVDVYEATAEFTQIGAGVAVWKRTWSIFQQLGITDALSKMVVKPPKEEPTPGMVFRVGDQPDGGTTFYQMVSLYGTITLHRADLLEVLTDLFPANFKAHFSKRLTHYTTRRVSEGSANDSSEVITLHFADGTTAEADVLIGCDGIKSPTRACMYTRFADSVEEKDPEESKRLRSFVQPSWTGIYAYRALVDVEALSKLDPNNVHRAVSQPLIYFGKNKHIVSYPISRGKLLNFIGFITIPEAEGTIFEGKAVEAVSTQEAQEHFADWEPEVRSLFSCIGTPSRWAISVVRGLPHYCSGNVALLGDAAHAMATHQGSGAGQAIEDAYILGLLLAHPSTTLSTIPSALQAYHSIRQPFANAVVESSRSVGFCYEFSGSTFENVLARHQFKSHEDQQDPSHNHNQAQVQNQNQNQNGATKLINGDKPTPEKYPLDLLQDLGEEIRNQWAWQWGDAVPEDDWVRAKEKFEELIGLNLKDGMKNGLKNGLKNGGDGVESLSSV